MKCMWLTLLAIASVTVKTFGERPNSPFCENQHRISCPSDLIPGGSCTVDDVFSQDCKSVDLEKSLDDLSLHYGTSELGDAKLEPYQYVGQYKNHPNVNISFSNIKWITLIAKFTVEMDKGNEVKCRNFTIRNSGENPPVSTVLFWDCHWFKGKDSWLPIKVEYQATNGSYAEFRKFYFRLPESSNIDMENTAAENWELLLYRETYGERSTIHWSKLPEKFGKTKYRVYQNELKECSDPLELEDKYELVGETQETSIDIKLPKYATCYNISVQPWVRNSSWGHQSYSLRFCINMSEADIVSSISMIAVSILLLVIILSCCCWHFFRFKKSNKVESKKCLLVCVPTSKAHLEVVRKLATFLKSLHVHLDFFHNEVERSNERPEDWWAQERGSNLILVVSSPNLKNTEDIMKADKYAPVFTTGFVEETLKLQKFSVNKPRFIRILLPHCSKSDFYDFLKAYPCYHVFKDRFKLLQEILGPHHVCLPWCVPWILYSSAFKAEPWMQFKEAAVKDISNTGDVKVGAKNESLHSLIGDSSIAASEDDEDIGLPEQINHLLLQMLDEENSLDDNSVVASNLVEREEKSASQSSPNEALIDEKMNEMYKYFRHL